MTGGLPDPVIVAARRSAVVPRGGALARLQIHDLAAPVLAEVLADAGLDCDQIGEVILANALGGGGNPARLAALAAGLPERVAGLSLDRQCCGGMDAVLLADAVIRGGLHEVVVAGGAESYSRRPLRLRTDPDGGSPVAYDRPPFSPWPGRDPEMAEAAETLARLLAIPRADQDAWTVQSHTRALAARDRLGAEITPVQGQDHDAFARAISVRTCARAPVLCGSITAANTAVAADAAGLCLLVSGARARRLGLPGLRVLHGVTLGADPALPGLAPVPAIRAVLAETGLAPGAFAAIEVMEAFAVQAIACVREAGLPPERVNPGGGALARGHPIGASGAINVVRLFHELRAPGQLGLCAIAAAGGLGTALVVERV